MTLRPYAPEDPAAAAWVRDVTDAIERAEHTVRLRWNDTLAPMRVATPLSRAPRSVRVIGATSNGGATRTSGAAVTWAFDGSRLVVHALDGLTTSTDYEVTLGLEVDRG